MAARLSAILLCASTLALSPGRRVNGPPTSARMCAQPPPLPRKLARLAAALRGGDAIDQRSRTLRLLRVGERLPPAPLLELGEATRVPGCVSVVHVRASVGADGRLRLSGAADSRVARGLVALLVRGLQGAPPEALRQLGARQLAEAAALPGSLSPGRLNGLDTMVRVMVRQLEAAEEEAAAVEAEAAATTAVPAAAASPPPSAAASPPRLLWSAADEEVAVLLSGGVDSSVALHELLAAGRRVRAFYLRIWLEDEQAHAAKGDCPWEEDWAVCEAVCAQAGVPLESVSLQHEYQEHVVGYLVAEAAAGRTPNPDIMCNSRIKFGVFHDRVGRHFASVASGHYARTEPDASGRVRLLRSADAHKDQTYFLSQLRQEQLANTVFPIGSMPKSEVRERARALQLPNRERKDSQGICFLGQLDYDTFLADHLGERPGVVLEHETGVEIGQHRGLWFHTVGQRRGLGPTLSNAYLAKGPWHVVRKDFDANVLYASRHYADSDKARNAFTAEGLSWVAGAPPAAAAGAELPLQVKVRHGAAQHDALVTLDAGGRSAAVRLAGRDHGLAPGQFAAFYDGEVCLGSGVIGEDAAS